MNKTIEKLSKELNCTVTELTYHSHGCALERTGFELKFNDAQTWRNSITIEPCSYSNGDKWFIYGLSFSPVFYAKNIREARKKILKVLANN